MTVLFWKILNMSLAGSVVIAAVLLIRAALSKAPRKWSYLLWLAPALRLLCPIGFSGGISLFSFFRRLPVAASGGTFTELRLDEAMKNAVESAFATSAQPGAAIPEAAGNVANTGWTASFGGGVLQQAEAVAACLWAAGMAILLVIGLVRYVKVKKQVADAIRQEDNVFETDRVSVPFILGIIRPHIYLPVGMNEEVRRYVLAHERYHLERRDYLIKLLAYFVLVIHWFNPLVWLAFRLMSRDMEMSCDEKVLLRNGEDTVVTVKAYSRALLSIATGKAYRTPSLLAFGETGVRSRIRNVLKWKQPRKWVQIALAILCVTVVAGCMSNPKPESFSSDTLLKTIGRPQAEALKQLGLKEEDVTASPGMVVLPAAFTMEGKAFEARLIIDRTKGEVDGYQYALSGNEETLMPVLSALMEKAKTEYGEPSTYPGLDNRYYGTEDPAVVWQKKGTLAETWNLSTRPPFAEVMRTKPDGLMFVEIITLEKMGDICWLKITYGVQADPNAGRWRQGTG